MTLKKGDILGQRYEIIEKVGVGGMSAVYLATDTRLGRDVAVKVLKEELAAEEDIKARFGDEAKSAASLIHPNIVNVYDVGEDNGLNFIVMEHINGKTLKSLIKAKAPFDSITTISIAIQIAAALSYAHENKIIHRDIKPQNIMIASNGNVKVMDFGIARAANISTLTNVVSAIGSVHYLSPEQARGGFIDNKSDIYSLGITMFEMVTGKLPFSGENSVSIALKHINDDLPDMREYNPGINRSLEGIIRKAANKKADERYSDIYLMLDDLKMALSEVSAEFMAKKTGAAYVSYEEEAQPEVKSNPEKFYNIDMSDKDKEIPHQGQRDVRVWFDSDNTPENTMREVKEDMKEAEEEEGKGYSIPASTVGFDMYSKKFNIEAEDPEKASVRKHFKKVEEDYDDDDDYDDDFYDEYEEGYTKKEERKVVAAAIVTAIIIIAVIVFIGFKFFFGEGGFDGFKLSLPGFLTSEEKEPEEEEITEIPFLIGMSYEEAYETYRGKGFAIVKAGTDKSDSFAEGVIISQDIDAGTEITDGISVNVIVSEGSAFFSMPDVMGITESEAETKILYAAQNAGAENITISAEYEFSSEIEMGIVMDQSFGTSTDVMNGSEIVLTVSKGEESAVVAVPNVEGKPIADAEKAILEKGLLIGNITTIESDIYDEGIVITQTIKAGEEIAKNSAIDLIVSEGKGSAASEDTNANEETKRGTVIYTIEKPEDVKDEDSVKIKLFKVDVSGTTTTLIETQRLGSEFPFDVQLVGEGQAEIQLYINDQYQWSKNVSF